MNINVVTSVLRFGDPYVFGAPGSGSISGSFYQAKIERKTLILIVT